MDAAKQTGAESADTGGILREFWYVVAAASDVRRGRMVHRVLAGEPLVIARAADNSLMALRDTCPHRGTLLSEGRFENGEIICPYHGWRFNGQGRCTHIPSLTGHEDFRADQVRTRTFPVAERGGLIWVYAGTDGADKRPPPPDLPEGLPGLQLHLQSRFDCGIDPAVSGLMDPAHGPFVHKSRFWRSEADIVEKRKAFSPAPMGWRMDAHTASANSRAYRIFLGSAPVTEITYTLPALRIEVARTSRYTYVGLTCCTPVSEAVTDVHHAMYWNVPGGALLRPVIRRLGARFLEQDRRAVIAMVRGLAFNPPTMLIPDADTQTRWYLRLKREYLAACKEGRAFANPIAPVDLRWRS